MENLIHCQALFHLESGFSKSEKVEIRQDIHLLLVQKITDDSDEMNQDDL